MLDSSDLVIAAKNQENANEQHKDIYTGEVWADDLKLHFSENRLFSDKLVIMLPDEFDAMPAALAKLKYPMEQRPAIIKTSVDSSVNFAFSLFNTPFSSDQVEEATNGFKSAMRTINPHYTMISDGILQLEKDKVGYFDFKSPALDGPLYQLFAFTPINNGLLHLIFSSPMTRKSAWDPLIPQVLKSIKSCK